MDILQNLRDNFEAKLKHDWTKSWMSFGEYDAAKLNRRSKFYETLAQEISEKSGIKVSRDTVHRFDVGKGGNSKNSIEAIARYIGYNSYREFEKQNFIPEKELIRTPKWLYVLFIFPAFFLFHRVFIRPYQLEEKLEKVILEANKAQFQAFQKLDTTGLGKYYTRKGAAIKSIVCVVNESIKAQRSISEPEYNPSFYKIMNLKVVDVQDSIATAITDEHWLLKWYEPTIQKYTVSYDETNKQYYELKLNKGVWKIDNNIYEGEVKAIEF